MEWFEVGRAFLLFPNFYNWTFALEVRTPQRTYIYVRINTREKFSHFCTRQFAYCGEKLHTANQTAFEYNICAVRSGAADLATLYGLLTSIFRKPNSKTN